MAKCTADDVLESIDAWTVLELNKLVKGIEEKYGVSAAPAVVAGAVAAAPAAGGVAAAEKTEFDAVLTSSGDKKIQVIKVVRELTGLGLKEAKDLVEGAPKPIKTGLPKAQAEDIKKKIEEVGGVVEIK